MREHTRAPARLTFFLFIYFHTEVRKAIRSMNLLSTFVFFLVCMCMRVRVRVFTCVAFTTIFSHLSIVPWLLLLFHHLVLLFLFCPIIIRSLTFSFVEYIILPPFYLAFPVSFIFGSALFRSSSRSSESRKLSGDT